MAPFAYLILFLTIFVVDAMAVDNLKKQIISEVKAYFDKELAALKRKHDTEIAALDARLTKSQAEIADLRSQNELLSNGLRKVLFTNYRRCRDVCQSFGDVEKQTEFGGNQRISEAKTPLQRLMNASKGFEVRNRKQETTGIISPNSAVNIEHLSSGIKNQVRGEHYSISVSGSQNGQCSVLVKTSYLCNCSLKPLS